MFVNKDFIIPTDAFDFQVSGVLSGMALVQNIALSILSGQFSVFWFTRQ